MFNLKRLALFQSLIIVILVGYILFSAPIIDPSTSAVDLTLGENAELSDSASSFDNGTNSETADKADHTSEMTAYSVSQKSSINPSQNNDPKNETSALKGADLVEHLLETLLQAQISGDVETILNQIEDELFELAQSDPGAVAKMLEYYNEIFDAKAEEMLAEAIASSYDENLEKYALENLETTSGVESRKWYRLLSYAGAKSNSSRGSVLSEMQVLTDPEMLSLAINTLAPINTNSAERSTVIERLNQYTSHYDENVRASAIEIMGYWANKDQPQFILDGLNDPSHVVKSSAIATAFESGIKSNALKEKLLQIAGDEKTSETDRLTAVNALRDYTLTDKEYDLVTRFPTPGHQ
jgi:hypothetical protein